MPDSFPEKYKTRLLTLKQWKRGIKPAKAVQNINTFMGRNFINLLAVTEWYQKFNDSNDDISNSARQILPTKLGPVTNFLDPIFLLNDNENSIKDGIVTNDGRFLFLFLYNYWSDQSFVVIHELFNGTKKVNPIQFKPFRSKFVVFGEYLLVVEFSTHDINLSDLHVLKINYENLSVKKLYTVNISVDVSNMEILLDQLDNQKFMIFEKHTTSVIKCHMENDKIDMEMVENLDAPLWHGMRLVGNELQGFSRRHQNPMTFHKKNLDTNEEKNILVPTDLCDNSSTAKNSYDEPYYWHNDSFYGMFKELQSDQNKLLMFDSLTLKWSDVQIQTQGSMCIYVDENEVLTFFTKQCKENFAAYRVALRKPDTLENLAQLTVLRESILYENHQYIESLRCPRNLYR